MPALRRRRPCPPGPPAAPASDHGATRTSGAAAGAAPATSAATAGRPVHPREISFTAARRAVMTTTRAGTATASLPASAITANRDSALASLARRRVNLDRHRDRTAKARPGFPPGGRRIPALALQAQISVCAPIAA